MVVIKNEQNQHPKEVLDKGTIETDIIPYLSKGKRGFEPGVELYKIVETIFYKLKTGCQSAMVSVKLFIKSVNIATSRSIIIIMN